MTKTICMNIQAELELNQTDFTKATAILVDLMKISKSYKGVSSIKNE